MWGSVQDWGDRHQGVAVHSLRLLWSLPPQWGPGDTGSFLGQNCFELQQGPSFPEVLASLTFCPTSLLPGPGSAITCHPCHPSCPVIQFPKCLRSCCFRRHLRKNDPSLPQCWGRPTFVGSSAGLQGGRLGRPSERADGVWAQGTWEDRGRGNPG